MVDDSPANVREHNTGFGLGKGHGASPGGDFPLDSLEPPGDAGDFAGGTPEAMLLLVGSLGRHCARLGLWAVGLVLVAATSAGLVRLLPWLLAEEVPLAVSAPFAQALAAVAVETAILVGLPLGFAGGAALLVERGEARALHALGASPTRLVAGTWPQALTFAAAALLSAVWFDVDASIPGRFAGRLIEQGQSSCVSAKRPKSVLVPMVGVTWLCFPGQPPRVVGKLPGAGDRAWFTAASLDPSDDLRRFELRELMLVTRRPAGGPALRLRVRHAVLSGMSGWGRPAKLPAAERAGLVAATAAALALLGAWVVLRLGLGGRIWGGALGALAGVAALMTLHRVDGSSWSGVAYLLVPLVGALASLALLALGSWLMRVAGRLRRRGLSRIIG